MDINEAQKKFASLKGRYNNNTVVGDFSKELESISKFDAQFNGLNKSISNFDSIKSIYPELVTQVNNLDDAIKIATKTSQNLKQQWAQDKSIANLNKQITDYVGRYQKVANDPAAMAQIESLQTQMQSGGMQAALAQKEWAEMSNSFKVAGMEAESLGSRLKSLWQTHGKIAVVMLSLNAFRQTLQAVWQTTLDLDSAMVELRKVTSETDATYSSFLDGVLSRSKATATSLTDVVNVTADWARLGYSMDEATKLADNTLIYKKCGRRNQGC